MDLKVKQSNNFPTVALKIKVFMTSKAVDLTVGARVLTGAGFTKKGEVRFIGETQFSAGEWVGIRLDTPDGKNDGTVGEVRYFESEALHGLFVKRAQVKIDNEAPSASASTREKLSLLREKRSSMLRDTGATPTPAAAASSSIPSLKTSSSNVSLTGKEGSGSSITPPSRTSRASLSVNLAASSGSTSTAGRSDPPSTPSRPSTSSTVAPTKSRIATAVAQTPAAPTPRSRTDKFATPAAPSTGTSTASTLLKKPSTASASSLLAPRRESFGVPVRTTTSRASLMPTTSTRTSRSAAATPPPAETEPEVEVEVEESPAPSPDPSIEPAADLDEDAGEENESEEEGSDGGDESPDQAQEDEGHEDHMQSVPEEEPTEEASEVEPAVEVTTESHADSASAEETDSADAAETEDALEGENEEEEEVREEESAPERDQDASQDAVEQTAGDDEEESSSEVDGNEEPAEVEGSDSESESEHDESADQEQAEESVNEPMIQTVPSIEPVSAAVSPAPVDPTPVSAPLPTSSAAPVVAAEKPKESVTFSTPVKDKEVVPEQVPKRAAADATPSKDAALIKFLQTSVFKLTEEKDELTARVSLLDGETASLNANLDASHALSVSLQADIEQHVSESSVLKATCKELQAEIESTKIKGNKEITTLKERIKTLENTPPPKDPRLPELERQVAELNSMVETLSLDKEQLSVEQEELDEKYLQCQIDLEEALAEVQALKSLGEAQAAAAGPRGSASVEEGDLATSLAALKIENDKLREALRRLNTVSVQDKQTLSTQTSRLTALENEATELRTYKRQAEGDLAALRSTVDSVASFEEMIETLAGKNMELSEQLETAQETVRDLEDSAELTEEIDQQQRAQMDADRAALDIFAVQLAAAQQHVVEKERLLTENNTALGRIKSANKTLKAEVQRLNLLLSSEFQESKQLESKLKELASLRANQELLASDLQTLYHRNLQTNSQKHKYQALYTRMDSIFGGTAVFIEESKLINTEIAFVSAVTSGLEACRGLGGVLDVILQGHTDGPSSALNWDILMTLSSTGVTETKIVPTLGKLYVLLLQAQGHAVQCNLELFKAQATGKTTALPARTVQRMIDFKARFEVVAQLSSRAKSLCAGLVQEYRAHCSGTANTQALLDATAEDADTSVVAVSPVSVEDGAFVPSDGSLAALAQLMGEYSSLLGDLVTHMAPISAESSGHGDCMDLIQNLTLLSSSSNVSAALRVELLYLSMNSLCDVALHQLDTEGVQSSSVSVSLALKSMKVDIKASIFNLKSNSGHFIEQLPDLTGNYQLLVSCFEDVAQTGLVLNVDAAGTESVVKLVQNFIRKVNSAPGLSANVTSTQQLLLGTAGVTRYFPYLLLTNTVSLTDAEQNARLREQFDQQCEKYWLLTMQTNSDLLVSTSSSTGSNTTAPGPVGRKSSDTSAPVASTAASSEVSWRQRVADARQSIATKFGANVAGADGGEIEAVEDLPPGTPAKSLPAVSGAKVQSLLHELDIKKDELRAAMGRCEDLQSQLDTALEAASKNNKRGGHETKDSAGLQKEISTLEEALFATEQRIETLEQEGKQMKAQIAVQSAILGSSGTAGAGHDGEHGAEGHRGGRRRNNVHTASTTTSVPLLQYQTALELSNHWKAMALKRLTASLLPLPAPIPLTAEPVGDSTAQPKSVTARPALSFKHIALLPSSGKATLLGVLPTTSEPRAGFHATNNVSAAEYAALYHDLRLARASGLRLKSLQSHTPTSTQTESADSKPVLSTGSARDRLKARNTLLYRIQM